VALTWNSGCAPAFVPLSFAQVFISEFMDSLVEGSRGWILWWADSIFFFCSSFAAWLGQNPRRPISPAAYRKGSIFPVMLQLKCNRRRREFPMKMGLENIVLNIILRRNKDTSILIQFSRISYPLHLGQLLSTGTVKGKASFCTGFRGTYFCLYLIHHSVMHNN